MSLTIQTWCAGDACDPCKPPPEEPPPIDIGLGLPPFTDAAIIINQIQIITDLRGNSVEQFIGKITIYSAIDNIPPQGKFGTPLGFGPPETSSISSSVVVYRSTIIILHPSYPAGSYNGSLPEITTGPLQPTLSSGDGSGANNQNASIIAGNAAIAQADQVLNL